ncbi:Conserved_hypothetical protein [Hexamita inflata]|uniref:Uncharacterized protein n=1 Tax=Hexamita inflata TaxID=28002 RepID=A0AA86RSE6_9EUKA|nr:Conserved hypothetical protein [Hexamita inflata]CAI9977149.1 Conserved hypothetical protein [Hexamita inflata]CAI9977151.1 Conserved hypothetical protein [Hexamita inflata]
MPHSILNTEFTLRVILSQIEKQLKIAENDITNDTIVQLLDDKKFNWTKPADILGIQKRSLKRWITETYQRQINKKVSKEDQQLLTGLITEAMKLGLNVCNKDLQLQMKSKLSDDYHWQSFYSAFSYSKRTATRVLEQSKPKTEDIDQRDLYHTLAQLLEVNTI